MKYINYWLKRIADANQKPELLELLKGLLSKK